MIFISLFTICTFYHKVRDPTTTTQHNTTFSLNKSNCYSPWNSFMDLTYRYHHHRTSYPRIINYNHSFFLSLLSPFHMCLRRTLPIFNFHQLCYGN
ncbi:hypothetical protein VIGAN_03296100 [Vigna angularis var. angularis]|uniref:Uncharacterized protein n=1 Tax=Vigna angularis var. angularis TaxID=157739 RepID=A0A0S3RQM5_PHAAN|nr:hypothetical protein VIGAN_03296100 [Vigna angularis var. angularis]